MPSTPPQMAEVSNQTKQIMALVEQIRPLLSGESPQIQGGALAELTATWLAGHVIADNPNATRTLRRELLDAHTVAVRGLTEVHAKIIGTDK